MKRLQIIDSTTVTLFSNLIFKGVGRHPKTGKKKGGIKVHTVIHANEGVPRIQHVVFTKPIKGGENLTHQARLITYADERKHRLSCAKVCRGHGASREWPR